MATPGGKKPSKQQINDAGNEIGLDLANAIGKAISQKLSTFDFTPIAKSLSNAVGKVKIDVDTSLVNQEVNKLNPLSLQALVMEVDTSLVNEEINKLNPLALQALITELDTSALDKLPPAQIQATVGEIQKPTRSVEDLFGPVEINPTVGKIDYDPTELVQTIKKSFMNLNTTLSIIGSTLRNGIGSSAFQPAIQHTATISKNASAIDVTFNEIADSVKDLKRDLKDSISVQQMLTTSAGLYGEMNGTIASTYVDLTKSSKEELKLTAQKLGIANAEKLSKQELVGLVGDALVKLKEEKDLVDNINSSYGDMERSMKQVQADINLKNLMMETGLTGEYAETARLKQLQLEQGSISEKEYAATLNKLKAEHHIYEEKVKQLELTESLANWQLEMKEELEEYEKGWEKIKSKIKAVITDPKLAKTVFAAEGIKTAIESVKKFGEGFEKMKEQGLSAGQAATAQIKTLSAMSVLGLSDTQGVMEQVIESYGNVNALSRSQVDNIGQMAHHMGITGQEAMQVNATLSQMTGETTESAIEAMHFTENLAKASGVAPGKVMKDIAKNSAAVALYSKDGAKGFGKAAIELHKMGVEISTAAKMADGLLDFESSINKQMEASVLLGRSINLDKARELALNGDLEGATREVLNNVGGAAEFTKMNVIQKKALAEAAGLTVEELQKALDAEEEQQKYHGEEAGFWMNTIGYVTEYGTKLGGFLKENGMLLLSGLNVLGQQETRQFLINGLQKAYNALSAVGNGIMQGGLGLVKMLFGEKAAGYAKDKAQWVLEKAHYAWLKAQAFLGSDKAKAKLADMATDKAKDLATDKVKDVAEDKVKGLAEDKAGDLADKAADKGMEKVSGVAEDKAGDLAGKATESADKLGESGEKVGKKGMTEGFKDNMTNIAEGFKQMGQGGVLKGIFNTLVAGPALVVALPSIPFLLFMGKIALNQLATNFTNLASGLTAMASTFAGSAALGVFAIASIPSILSIPFLLFMGLTPLTQLASNFTNLSVGLGAMAGTMAGSLGLAAFGLAAIPSIASIPFLLFMGLTPLAQLVVNLTSLATGLNAMAGTFVGSAALAAFGLAAAIAIPSLIFLGGVALLGAVGAAGLVALGIGLETLGAVAATGLPFLAIGLIATLGASMIPFAVALNIATPAIKAFGDILIGVFQQIPPIITAVAAGFVTIFSAMADNWQILVPVGIGLAAVAGGMLALGAAGFFAFPGLLLTSIGLAMLQGPLTTINQIVQTDAINKLTESLQTMIGIAPGLFILGAGLTSVGAAGILAFPGLMLASLGLGLMQAPLLGIMLIAQTGTLSVLASTMTTLASTSDGLFAVGGALFTIAGGLGAVAAAGLFALPVIGSLVALAALAPGLGSMFGGGAEGGQEAGGGAKEEKMDILIEEIRSLRAEMSKGGVVNLDGRKVGETLRLAMNTSGVR